MPEPPEMLTLFVRFVAAPLGLMVREVSAQNDLKGVPEICSLAWDGVAAVSPESIAVHAAKAGTLFTVSSRLWEVLRSPIKKMLPQNLNDEALYPADGECIRYGIPASMTAQERLDAVIALCVGYIKKDMVHPLVRSSTITLLRAFNLDGRETLLIGALLQKFNQTEITYIKDPIGRELLPAPHSLLTLKGGDCDCKSLLLVTQLASIGIPGAFLLISTRPDRLPNHILPCVMLEDGRYIPLECTLNVSPGWYPPNATYVHIVPIRYIP